MPNEYIFVGGHVSAVFDLNFRERLYTTKRFSRFLATIIVFIDDILVILN